VGQIRALTHLHEAEDVSAAPSTDHRTGGSLVGRTERIDRLSRGVQRR